MNPLRRSHLLRSVLETLNFARGYAVPESALRPQVDGLMQPPTSDEEWQAAVADLEARDAIKPIESELDPTLKQFAITQRGRVLLETL